MGFCVVARGKAATPAPENGTGDVFVADRTGDHGGARVLPEREPRRGAPAMTPRRGIVYVLDGNARQRARLEAQLAGPKLTVRTFGSAKAFLRGIERDRPGCLVLELHLPDIPGLEVLEKLARRKGVLPAIVVTGRGDVASAVRAMKAGAFDYLEKPVEGKTLLPLVRRAVLRSATESEARKERDTVTRRRRALSRRERQVYDLVVQGKSNKEVALAIGLSDKTVEYHRAKMMRGMEVRSVAELVKTSLI